ncbi:MAG: hypothetical protein LBU27_01055 [Candidatus Peribacteria bacterium]|nr:hypothetical protein [Candidatus Peribacteria bacterium]
MTAVAVVHYQKIIVQMVISPQVITMTTVEPPPFLKGEAPNEQLSIE